jgi:hypothetical protein
MTDFSLHEAFDMRDFSGSRLDIGVLYTIIGQNQVYDRDKWKLLYPTRYGNQI